MRYVLAYDLGTSSMKASVIDSEGRVLADAACEYPTSFGEGGFREQNPQDWEKAMIDATEKLWQLYPNRENIEAIGISGHSLGVVPVDRNGVLLTDRTPIWSDARAEAEAEEFFARVDYRAWYERTGNGFTRHLYSVFKLMWMRRYTPELYEKASVFLGTKDYLNLRLCGRACTDRSYASGSGVYDLRAEQYYLPYIEAAGLRESDFPEILPSSEIIGTLTPEMAQALGLSEKVRVVAGGVDNACMSLGAGCVGGGDAYVSLGTSSWVAAAFDTPAIDFDKKIYTWAHCVPGKFVPSSGIFSACSSLDWVRRSFFPDLDASPASFDSLAASAKPGSEGVLFCPVMAGGSYVDVATDMKGGLINFDLHTDRACVARAVLEGVAFDLKLSLEALEAVQTLPGPILFVGGGAKSDLWLSIFADIFGKSVVRGKVARHAASLGAAALALYGIGAWEDFSRLSPGVSEAVEPNPENRALYEKLFPCFIETCRACASLYRANSLS